MSAAAQSVFKTLRQLPSLTEFSDELLQLMATVGEEHSKPSGSVIFSEGERHSRIYLVSSGSIRLDMKTAKWSADDTVDWRGRLSGLVGLNRRWGHDLDGCRRR